MKEIIITLAAVLLPQMASAQSIENDSIVIKHPRKVTVVTSDSSQKIIVQGKEGDDDYEYRNTLQLVDALQKAGKDFQLMIYPDGMHGYRGPQALHSWASDHDFWLKYLKR